jgi:hypothetical protein
MELCATAEVIVKVSRHRSAVLFVVLLLACAATAACDRKVRRYDVPPNAVTTSSGTQYVVLRQGRGRSARDAGIWGVKWTLISHKRYNCAYPCSTDILDSRSAATFGPWRDVLISMRRDEIRRVWIRLPKKSEVETFDVELHSAIATDAAGQPIRDETFAQ